MKNRILLVLPLIFLWLQGCGQEAYNKNQNIIIQKNNSDKTNWKTYSSSRLGITFKYPDSWKKVGDEASTINLKGEVMAITISFSDSVSQTQFSIEYHLAPYGAELYKSIEEEFKKADKSSNKQIMIADNNALEVFSTLQVDIHGNVYNPAQTLIQISFLDKQKTGEFTLNFKTPEPNKEKEISKFNDVLSSFSFIK